MRHNSSIAVISIICPFYNEKENLGELAHRLQKVVRDFKEPWEIIFVDDGSSDGGGDYLQTLIPSDELIRLLRLDGNHGLSTAIFAGLQAAKGDILATLDSDLQNPPEEIPKLLSLMKDADIVTGVRKYRQDSWVKKVSSKIANRIRRSVTRDHLEDVGCSLRVFRREVVPAFYPFDGMHRFFLSVAEAEGFKIKQVPVQHEARRRGKSKYGLRNRILGPLWDLFAVHWMLRKKIRFRRRGEDHD